MDKLKLHTPDFTDENTARLAELFPNCVTEIKVEGGGMKDENSEDSSLNLSPSSFKRAIDFDLLRQELSGDLVEGPQERYRLDWPGKREALALANAPIAKTLRPCPEESVDFETTQNLYIEGDNLDALKLLQETYLGKVKMIYIDPPYNTGNDFIYDDNFSMSRAEYEELAGERDEEGNAMFNEEKWKQNSSASGRFHSEWLSMMYPRLKLARNLLREDGVIFASIDDRELTNLRRCLDEIFGSNQFLGIIPIVNNLKGRNDMEFVAQIHEYVIAYSKAEFRSLGTPLSEEKRSEYDQVDTDGRSFQWRDLRKRGGADTRKERPNLFYPVYIDPKTGDASLSQSKKYSEEALPRKSDGTDGCWRWGKETLGNRIEIVAGKFVKAKEGWNVAYKVFLDSGEDGERRDKPKSVWTGKEFSTDSATKMLNSLIPKINAKSIAPKPIGLLRHLCQMATKSDEIIVDFFSGSATTAHAVMQLNAEDGGKRRHIQVQLPEPCDEKSEAAKAGYATIAEIGKERIRRAAAKIRADLQAKIDKTEEGTPDHQTLLDRLASLDTGFRVLKIDSSNMAEVYYQPDEVTQDALDLQIDNVKPDRTPEDLLFQVLLDWGVDLGLPISEETLEDKRVFFVADNALAACFDTGLTEDFCKALAKRQPLRAVFRDAGYATDSTKINIGQIFHALSPHTELKTI